MQNGLKTPSQSTIPILWINPVLITIAREVQRRSTMIQLGAIVLFIAASLGGAIKPDGSAQASFDEKFYLQTLDHFNPQDARNWDHRYLFNDDNWDGSGALVNGCPGPILFYTGNEVRERATQSIM